MSDNGLDAEIDEILDSLNLTCVEGSGTNFHPTSILSIGGKEQANLALKALISAEVNKARIDIFHALVNENGEVDMRKFWDIYKEVFELKRGQDE
jgi:hypothetical protein